MKSSTLYNRLMCCIIAVACRGLKCDPVIELQT
jgi:hypothetical protein